MIKICKRCLYTSFHPLNITFDENGICSGCKVHEEKDNLNWSSRKKKLNKILSNYKSKSENNYDCIIPVSGARDSYFVVHIIKNIFKMNPLLVTYNKQYNTDVGIRNLANLRIKFDCDILNMTVNPISVKNITRSTLRRFGSIYWHCIAGETVFPVQIAVRLKIPLIIWGVHQGIDQVGMFSHLDEVEMTRKYRKEHDLMGYEAEDLIEDFDHLKEEDLHQFFYPDNLHLEQIGVRGIYLNNYIRWDTKKQHEMMIKLYGYETRKQSRTFDYYNDIDSWVYNELHDYLKMIKHGYTKVLDQACREIRFNRLSQREALNIVNYYANVKPRFTNKFRNWLNITKNSMKYIIDEHRNPQFWYRDKNWRWNKKVNLVKELNKSIKPLNSKFKRKETLNFLETNIMDSLDDKDNYILIGKGV